MCREFEPGYWTAFIPVGPLLGLSEKVPADYSRAAISSHQALPQYPWLKYVSMSTSYFLSFLGTEDFLCLITSLHHYAVMNPNHKPRTNTNAPINALLHDKQCLEEQMPPFVQQLNYEVWAVCLFRYLMYAGPGTSSPRLVTKDWWYLWIVSFTIQSLLSQWRVTDSSASLQAYSGLPTSGAKVAKWVWPNVDTSIESPLLSRSTLHGSSPLFEFECRDLLRHNGFPGAYLIVFLGRFWMDIYSCVTLYLLSLDIHNITNRSCLFVCVASNRKMQWYSILCIMAITSCDRSCVYWNNPNITVVAVTRKSSPLREYCWVALCMRILTRRFEGMHIFSVVFLNALFAFVLDIAPM